MTLVLSLADSYTQVASICPGWAGGLVGTKISFRTFIFLGEIVRAGDRLISTIPG